MWRKVGNVAVVNRSTRLPGYDTLRVAPAVIEGALRYIIFDTRSPAKVVACFGDESGANGEAIVSAALGKLHKYRWQGIRGLNNTTWHVSYPTMPFNRRSLFNVRLSPCVTDAGEPGVALYDHSGVLLFMGHFNDRLDIRNDKTNHKRALYNLLMEVYCLDWLGVEEE